MTRTYRYSVQLTDGGNRVHIQARDWSGETINEPGGNCTLATISSRISQLVDKIREGKARRAEMEELGVALFDSLFPLDVSTHLRGLLPEVFRENAFLRLELDLDEAALPAVAALPWEFLRAPQTAGRAADNLSTHPGVVLARRRSLWDVAQPITLNEPLRIQLVVSAPSDQKSVVYEEVEVALRRLAAENPDKIAPLSDTLHQPDQARLDRVLEEQRPHILHFIGHGRLRKTRGVEFGELALVGTAGIADWRTDEEIGELFQTHCPPLVILQACESGTAGSVGAFVGVASQIVQRNVPVVVAMQYPVSNQVAVTFAEEFYRRIGELEPVDLAVQKSRRRLRQKQSETRDFAAPIIFMRVKDGRLFVAPESGQAPEGEAPAIQPEHKKEAHNEAHSNAFVRFSSDTLVNNAPHPIATGCDHFNRAETDTQRFSALDLLINNTVKYLSAIALSQYWQDNPDKQRLREWLNELSQTRLLTSLTILNRISDHYASEPARSLLPTALFEPYTLPMSEESPIVLAYRRIRKLQPAPQARDEDITPRTFLNILLEYRQTRWEVNAGHVEESVRSELLAVLPSALQELLQQFHMLLRYPLYYIEYIDQTEKGRSITLTMFPGVQGKAQSVDSPFIESNDTDAPVKLHRLYLCSPDQKFWLNLHPFLIAHLHELYFLEQKEPGEEIWFARCTPPERYKRPAHALTILRQSLEGADQGDVVEELEETNAALEKEENTYRFHEMPLDILLNAYLSNEGRQVVASALGESLRIGRFWLGIEFLLMGLSRQRDSVFVELLHTIGLKPGELRGTMRTVAGVATSKDWRRMDDVESLGRNALPTLHEADPATLAATFDPAGSNPPVVTPRMMTVLRAAAKLAYEAAGNETLNPPRVGTAHLLLAALTHTQCLAVNVFLGIVVQQTGRDPNEIIAWVAQRAEVALKPSSDKKPDIPPIELRLPRAKPAPDQSPRPFIAPGKGVLAKLGRDLTDLAKTTDPAKAGKLRPAVGSSARKAMVQVGLILQQTQANNPVLLGDPGVGKTAIVEGFAHRLATDPKVIPQLASRRVVELPLAALMAGTKYRGDLEERIQQILNEVRSANGQTIIFIDEIHTILGNKSEGGMAAIADALKPALARGEFPCIGATTVAEYRRYIESDPALARRFTPVWLEEPTIEEAITIVAEVAQNHLSLRHGVAYPDDVIKEAVHLAVRYIPDEFLPGKAIKLLDQAGPQVVMGGSLSGLKDPDGQFGTGSVSVDVLRAIVSERTGIPLSRLGEDEKQRLVQLEQTLQKRVKGQDEAVMQVAQVIKRARAGLANPRRPLGVFLFAGPTGVGKTELALALAEALFGQEEAILRLDMSEFMEKHHVSRLIGSPPGYVGYHEEGQLTGKLRRRPYSVVLLDEMEKAHKEVQHLFLQLFDSGRITDASGKLADGRNALFIMTTNLGAKEALGFAEQRQTYQQKLQNAIEEHFTPEFLNRIDRIVHFNPLDEALLLDIFDKLFARVAERFREQKIEVIVPDSFKRALCRKYTNKNYGARYLERAIEDEIVAPLTNDLLAEKITTGMPVTLPEIVDPQDQEAQNRATFERQWQEFKATMERRDITVIIDEATIELLCSPALAEQREGKNTSQAFISFVEMPLNRQFSEQRLMASDRVRVYRTDNRIEFKRIREEDEQ